MPLIRMFQRLNKLACPRPALLAVSCFNGFQVGNQKYACRHQAKRTAGGCSCTDGALARKEPLGGSGDHQTGGGEYSTHGTLEERMEIPKLAKGGMP